MSIDLPSVLSFERKLEVSDALMFSGNWGETPENEKNWKEVRITKRQNRSTQSAYGIDDAKKSEPNPVSSDSDDANLPIAHDTLKLSFTLRVIGNIGKPFACNEPNFETEISNKVRDFKVNEPGLKTLAFRYAYNIVNGRFLWRNRVCAENILILVETEDAFDVLKFNAYDFSMNDFERNAGDEKLEKLTQIIFDGLNGNNETFAFIKVNAYVKLGSGQHVFPSQEMNMGEKKKVLFQLDSCAAIHNVKIGNAIRTIDNWYKSDAEFPIAIEPYGSVTQMGQAYRKSNIDFYSLMLRWLNEVTEISMDDKNYIVANLIRGGVFGGKSD